MCNIQWNIQQNVQKLDKPKRRRLLSYIKEIFQKDSTIEKRREVWATYYLR